MEWKEINIFIPPKATDLVALRLYEHGSNGAVIHDDEIDEFGNIRLTVYYPAEDKKIVTILENNLDQLAKTGILGTTWRITSSTINDDKWLYSWQKYFHVKKITNRFWVEPAWEKARPGIDELVITIEPGKAFGSGIHETTCLCIEFLEKIVMYGDSVIDVGTGTGILAIAAAKLGADKVVAVDNDLIAVKQASVNVSLNNVKKIVQLNSSNLLEAVQQQVELADVIVANIVADAIISLMPTVGTYLKEQGYFIASGIIDERIDDVRQAAKNNGFMWVDDKLRNGWYAVCMRWQG